ncbi:hypothetical protein, partial [Nocardia farcinica]|uniref:hypothetical protein n=1 Tax=Nocardia farcinica TaxID=37329 RepID=UPI0024540408
FTPHEPARAATRTNHLGRYLAIHGESGGHQRGLKWPPMGRMSWPLTRATEHKSLERADLAVVTCGVSVENRSDAVDARLLHDASVRWSVG